MKHKTDKNVQAARLHAIELFPKENCNSEIARRVGVARQTIVRWRKTWEEQGPKALSVIERGPKHKLTNEQWHKIEGLLLKGAQESGYSTDLWTLERIADLIHKETGILYHPGHVWLILRNMGWSCQKPQVKAKERDEEAIQCWCREDWPEIKRGHRKTAQG